MNFQKQFTDFIKTPDHIYLDKYDRSKKYNITSNWKDAYCGIICKFLLNHHAPNAYFIKHNGKIYSVIEIEQTENVYLLPKNRGLGLIIAVGEILAIENMDIQIINRNGKKIYYTGMNNKPFQFKKLKMYDFNNLIEYDRDLFIESQNLKNISREDLNNILNYCEKELNSCYFKDEILNRFDVLINKK